MPDGEIFTCPEENSVDGHIWFNYPGLYMGNIVEDIHLEFKKGKCVSVKAAKGEELMKKLLAIDEGAKRLGEVAIGTNHGIKKFTHSILFDEKIAGTIHMALGRGDTVIGSKNHSAIHWDMIKDMKKGEILRGPLVTNLVCSSSIVSNPPMPEPMYTPTLCEFSGAILSPELAKASSAAAIA